MMDNSSVGMMKFPTEWTVINFMLQTTSNINQSRKNDYYPMFPIPNIWKIKAMFQTTNQSLDDQKDVRKRSKKGGIEQM